jgi:hypothetical protein
MSRPDPLSSFQELLTGRTRLISHEATRTKVKA